MILTPQQASVEFGILLSKIIRQLSKNEAENLELIKMVCSFLTVGDDQSSLLFSDEQQEAIQACDNMRTLFTKTFRHMWRWDDFSLLKTIIQSLDSADGCETLIEQYEKKLYSQIKLKEIQEFCKQECTSLPRGYHKMVAIVQEKSFLSITLEEYNEIKAFILQNCKVEPYIISPFIKASVSSLLLEWLIPSSAVSHMIKMATDNSKEFIVQNFVLLKISSMKIFDKRDNVSYVNNEFICMHLNNSYVAMSLVQKCCEY